MYFGVFLPIAVILLYNFAVFCMICHNLCKNKPLLPEDETDQSKLKQSAMKRLQNAFAMSILMVLTWAFGFLATESFLAIEDSRIIFSLIFCVCSSFQGLVIFLLFCVRQEDVRKTLHPYTRRLCCRSATLYNTIDNETANADVLYSNMESSASAPPHNSAYSDVDIVDPNAALPMLSDPSNDSENTTGDATEENGVLVAINDKELVENTKIPVVVNVQEAAWSGTQNVTPQAYNGVLLGEHIFIQDDNGDDLHSEEEKIPMEKVNEGMPGQNDVGFPEEEEDEGRYGENEKLL